jgi:hypothetical protein
MGRPYITRFALLTLLYTRFSHNEELHNLYASPNIIRVIKSRRMRWAGHIARTREMRNAYKNLVRKLGRPRRMWEDDIRIDLRETGWGSVD